MSHIRRTVRATGAAVLLAGITGAAVLAFAQGTASAKTTTMHFFSKNVSDNFYQANGQLITNPNAQPAVGDYFISTDLDYTGNAKKHAKTATASDNLVCTITTATQGVCDGSIAIGGSLLLANHVTIDIASNNPVVPINGGTGQFKGAHGTVTTVEIGNTANSNFTVTYSN